MTAEFLERFAHFVDAPDGIRRLRELVLQLAVRGKLVAQDHQELLPPTYAALPTHPNLPPSWRFLNFGHYCDIQGGSQPPKSTFVTQPQEGYVRLLQIRDLGDKPVPVFIPADSTKRFCREGEILIARYGASVGKIFWAQDGAYNVALTKFLWPSDSFIAEFVFLLLKSTVFQAHLEGASRSAQAGFNKKDLASINFPLPPLAEQHRIVAKVDELMALCDQLEAERNARDATHTRLIRAVHHPLTEASDAASTATAWQRIRNHFTDLYTTRESVRALRQTILQLAVQGKLVAQNPGEEPARSYLVRIGVTPPGIEEKPHHSQPPPQPLPSGWEWIQLRDFGAFKGGGTPSKQNPRFWAGSIPWVSPKDMKVDRIADAIDHVSESAVEETSIKMIEPNALLIVTRGMILAHSFPVAITTTPVTINQDMKALELPNTDLGNFMLVAMKGNRERLLRLVQRSSHGTCRVDTPTLADITIGFPPKPEQHRIVAKVDELMNLCDQLDAAITSRDATASRYAEAVVTHLTTERQNQETSSFPRRRESMAE